ncbi:MAG TPA: hypothetical protein VJB35_06625 [Candidatus Nanoarchaeia archaeon]|nr:hypothetical protein [Candidatus Nanoarchaeia archaeon]
MTKVNSRAKWEEMREIIPPATLYLWKKNKLIPKEGKAINLEKLPISLRELQAKGWEIQF